MSRDDRPAEQPAVRTTIVGGRPPGSGKPVGPIPRGLEVLIKKAAVDGEFRALLLDRREAAADEIGLTLDPAEALMLRAVPREQLQTIIARTKVEPSVRPAFLGRAAAVMLVALGAGTLGCEPQKPAAAPPAQQKVEPPAVIEITDGIRPNRPDVRPLPPQSPPSTSADSVAAPPPAAPPAPAQTTVQPAAPAKTGFAPWGLAGVAPDVPAPKPAADAPKPPDPQPVPPAPPAPTGIRPDRPPTTKGVQPDRPDVQPPAAPAPSDAGRPTQPPTATRGGTRPDQPTPPAPPPTPPPTPPAPTGIRPDRPPTPPTPPPVTGIQPDRPPGAAPAGGDGAAAAPTTVTVFAAPATDKKPPTDVVTRGVRPDKPPKPPAAPSEPGTGTAAAEPTAPAQPKPIVSRAITLPEAWDEKAVYEALAQGLKRLADAHLPEHKFIFSTSESGQRFVRIEWKPEEYNVPEPDPETGNVAVKKRKGPAADGLLLTVWIETRLVESDRPHVRDNGGFWRTKVDQVFLRPLKTYLKFNEHYGPKTDRDLLATFADPAAWLGVKAPAISTEAHLPPPDAAPSHGAPMPNARPSTRRGDGSFGISPDRP